MDRHIALTIVRNSAGDARVIWSIFSGYHPQELRESGAKRMVQQQKWRVEDLILRMPKFGAQWQVNEFYFTIFRFSTQAFCKGTYISFSYFFSDILREGELSKLTSRIVRTQLEEKFGVSFLGR